LYNKVEQMKQWVKFIFALVLMVGLKAPLFAFNKYETYIISGLKKGQEEKNEGRKDSIVKSSMLVYYYAVNEVLQQTDYPALDVYLGEVAEGHKKLGSGKRKKIQIKFGQEFYTQAYWLLVDLRMIELALGLDTHRQAVYYDKNKHQGHCECGKCGND
jgi:hypothetical protein